MLRRKLINPLQIGGFVRHDIMIFLLVIRDNHQRRLTDNANTYFSKDFPLLI